MLLSGLQNIAIDGMRSLNILSRLIPGGFSCEVKDINIPIHDQLSSVFLPSLIRAYDHLENIEIENLDLEVVFNLEDVAEIAALKKLHSLYIGGMDNMRHVWWKVPRNFKGFHNLTDITVRSCNKLRYFFSPSIAKCLVKLQCVSIRNCDMIEEVVSTMNEEGEKEVQKRSDDIVFFPQLKDLELRYLPCVTCINLGVCGSDKLYMEASNAETTQMLHHEVNSSISSSISTLISTKKSNITSLASMRTVGIMRSWSFLHLTGINMVRCQNMSTLFPPSIQVNLPVLKILTIRECDNLRYIFFSNPNLRSLELLDIKYCKMLEVIVKDDVEEGGGRSNFVFPALNFVLLESLPSLEGFCFGKCTFDWPSLTNMKIDDCFRMKIFTSGRSTMPLLHFLIRDSAVHNLADEGGNINTTLKCALEKDLDNSNNALKEQCNLTCTGFMLAADHLVAQCSSWCWGSRYWKYLIRKDVPCLERVRPSNLTRPALDAKDIDKNDDAQHYNIHGPRKYDIVLNYEEYKNSTNMWLNGYDPQTATRLPLELVLQDIHESYPQECVIERDKRFGNEIFNVNLKLNENSSSYIKDIYAREGVQPDFINYFSTWLSAVVPTIKCLDK